MGEDKTGLNLFRHVPTCSDLPQKTSSMILINFSSREWTVDNSYREQPENEKKNWKLDLLLLKTFFFLQGKIPIFWKQNMLNISLKEKRFNFFFFILKIVIFPAWYSKRLKDKFWYQKSLNSIIHFIFAVVLKIKM